MWKRLTLINYYFINNMNKYSKKKGDDRDCCKSVTFDMC